MIISTKGKTTMDVVVDVMTKKKKTDLCPLCWPELEATSKFWDSMPGKENLSTTRLCVMVCPLRMPSILNGWSGISGASLRNSSEPMSVFLWGICASLVMRVLKPLLMECHVKDWADNMYSQGTDYFFSKGSFFNNVAQKFSFIDQHLPTLSWERNSANRWHFH